MGIWDNIQNLLPSMYTGYGSNNLPNVRGSQDPSKYMRDLRNYISPIQVERSKQDVKTWREAIEEAERAYWPFRVKMQKIFLDTAIGGEVKSAIQKRKELTTLREFCFKDISGKEDELTKIRFQKKWFTLFLEYALEAKLYGYTLISLGDIDETLENPLSQLSTIRRSHISPDRLDVGTFTYMPDGAKFMEEPFTNWYVYVSTPSETGASPCGYGELYSVAIYEIMLRNLYGQNADTIQVFGQPIRVGTTDKTDAAERNEFELYLKNVGANSYLLKDSNDMIEFIESKGIGNAYKIYGDFDTRLSNLVSKLLLGHSDAMKSTPGKLGGGQGGEESPAEKALKNKQASDGAFLEDVINGSLLPRLRAIGMNIPEGLRFSFSNNGEIEEKNRQKNEDNKAVADIAYQLKQAGLDVDPQYITDRTGIPVTKVVVPAPVIPALPKAVAADAVDRIKKAVSKLYSR